MVPRIPNPKVYSLVFTFCILFPFLSLRGLPIDIVNLSWDVLIIDSPPEQWELFIWAKSWGIWKQGLITLDGYKIHRQQANVQCRACQTPPFVVYFEIKILQPAPRSCFSLAASHLIDSGSDITFNFLAFGYVTCILVTDLVFFLRHYWSLLIQKPPGCFIPLSGEWGLFHCVPWKPIRLIRAAGWD